MLVHDVKLFIRRMSQGQQATAQCYKNPLFDIVWADPFIPKSCKCRDAGLRGYPVWLCDALSPYLMVPRSHDGFPTANKLLKSPITAYE
jgi:hypothetical protein